MDIETKLDLINRPPMQEVVTRGELRSLLETNAHPNHYIGLEISGLPHLGTLVVAGLKINDFMMAGVRCKVFLADWHTFLNDKFGRDWNRIRRAARLYEEAFKFFCPGVEILLGSDLYHDNDEYWRNIVQFSKELTLARNMRCLNIMGRKAGEKLDFGQYLYPPMQAVDIHTMDLDIAHAGIDQRRIHMVVREVFPKLGWKVPVAVHHPLLMGLDRPAEPVSKGRKDEGVLVSSKMSKSKPWTCIFVLDDEKTIDEKIRRAWCPEGVVEFNPILEFAKHLILRNGGRLHIERASKYGGPLFVEDFKELATAFRNKKLHPLDLKETVSQEINRIVAPIRKHLIKMQDLLEVFKGEGV